MNNLFRWPILPIPGPFREVKITCRVQAKAENSPPRVTGGYVTPVNILIIIRLSPKNSRF